MANRVTLLVVAPVSNEFGRTVVVATFVDVKKGQHLWEIFFMVD